MSNRRMSMGSIYDSLLGGRRLSDEQHDYLAGEVYADNMEKVTWHLLTLGKPGWHALQQLFFNTGCEEVRGHCESIFQEKEAEPVMVQRMDSARYPAIGDVRDRALSLGPRFRVAKSHVIRGFSAEAALSAVYA